jgi:hypothetical protein
VILRNGTSQNISKIGLDMGDERKEVVVRGGVLRFVLHYIVSLAIVISGLIIANALQKITSSLIMSLIPLYLALCLALLYYLYQKIIFSPYGLLVSGVGSSNDAYALEIGYGIEPTYKILWADIQKVEADSAGSGLGAVRLYFKEANRGYVGSRLTDKVHCESVSIPKHLVCTQAFKNGVEIFAPDDHPLRIYLTDNGILLKSKRH